MSAAANIAQPRVMATVTTVTDGWSKSRAGLKPTGEDDRSASPSICYLAQL